MKRILAALLLCAACLGAFAQGKPTELVMYLIGSPGKDYDMVLAEFNKKAQADLDVTLKVEWIGWGDFSTKYPLVLASGEPIDLIYTSTWLNFYQQAQKGAFLPLETIGPKYAPQSFALEPKDAIRQATIEGHLYALPPNYTTYATYGTLYRGDLLKKYGLPEIKTMDDYGKYLEAVVKNDKGMDPSGLTATQHAVETLALYPLGLYPLSGDPATNSPFWVYIDTGKVVNIADLPETPATLAKLKSWSDKGYWPKSVLSNKDDQMFQNGKAASRIHLVDTWASSYNQHPEWDVRYTSFLPHSYPLPYMQDGMAVPASSKNPEKALQLLEKMRNDESYNMLLTYGIRGKHYDLTADNRLKTLDTDAWTPEMYCSWGIRDSRYIRVLAGYPPNYKEVKDAIAKTARTNIYSTFSQNIEPVKNEYAAVLNVMQQYYLPLKLGYVDPVQGLATLKQKLKAAGVEKVLTEFQKQVDAYKASVK
jgi:ABC-type sugar transport system, periplasmic component